GFWKTGGTALAMRGRGCFYDLGPESRLRGGYALLPPEEAVVAARRWELEDRNTWRPPGQEVRVTRGRWTVGCGDWAAMTEAQG
ncbi:MAG: hypothetical protein PHZ19_05480, partial [Candidatus Thermoplasmatota archaeon]|nr:hypothetical protein [Candidatus Thermoplasmatota archaeon]